MKKCSRCLEEKHTTEYNKQQSTKDGLSYYCRGCVSSMKKAEYAKNPEIQKARSKARWLRNRTILKELKASSPCMDCGQWHHQYVMDYDHVRGDKIAAVSHLANRQGSTRKIYEEIEKCELVCSNCHRYRTWNRLHPEEPIINPAVKHPED